MELKSVNTETKEEVKGTASETAHLLEENAKNAPVKDVHWNANEVQTEAVKIDDPMQGDRVVLRHFFFSAPVWRGGFRKPNKMDLVNENKKLIEVNLWVDGLRPVNDRLIECHTRRGVRKLSKILYTEMVKNNADFVIQVLCEPAKGHIWSTHNPEPSKAI